jgi:tRNA-Thr(GGU) m(6)t(6)A37 methyltransferase TsaA
LTAPQLTLEPIGIIHSPFQDAADTPIQPAYAGGAEGRVELMSRYTPALADLAGFERIWLLYWFDRTCESKMTVVPFRDRVERGLFATRAPCRPNPIGMSCVRLRTIENNIIHVSEIDVLDRTPLLDIKPYAPDFDSFPEVRYGWLEVRADTRTRADNRFRSDSER